MATFLLYTLLMVGTVNDLHNNILPYVVDYDVVMWFANVPNDEVKLRDVKAINPRLFLLL